MVKKEIIVRRLSRRIVKKVIEESVVFVRIICEFGCR